MSAYPASVPQAAQRPARGNPTVSMQVRNAANRRGSTGASAPRTAPRGAPKRAPWGKGNQVMGGVGVGPTGKPQPSLMDSQFSVSGARGRRSETVNATQQQLPGGGSRPVRRADDVPSRRGVMRPPTNGSATVARPGDPSTSILHAPDGGRRMILTYNSGVAPSMETFNAIVSRSTPPHPKLFEWSVLAIDIRSPRLPLECEPVVRSLRGMPEFQRDLSQSCVLFDRVKKVAYKDAQLICQVIQAQKDNIVSALVERQNGAPGTAAANSQPGLGSSGGGQGGDARSLMRASHSVTQPAGGGGGSGAKKSIRQIARRSVLQGVDPSKLDVIAKTESQRIRREAGGGGGNGPHRSAPTMPAPMAAGDGNGGGFGLGAIGGGAMAGPDGISGTLFEGIGSGYQAAEAAYGSSGGDGGGGGGGGGGGDGLSQIEVKNLRR